MEPWLVALISAIASGSVTVIGATFWFGRNTVTKDDLISATATMTTEIHDLRDEIDAHGRQVGETISSIRQRIADVDSGATKKITEVELYVRDTFVRRDSWHNAMNQIQERWAAGEKIAEERSLRLEAKVDRIVERLMGEK
jgi:hypothetical protein